jgi:hypothetical protein
MRRLFAVLALLTLSMVAAGCDSGTSSSSGGGGSSNSAPKGPGGSGSSSSGSSTLDSCKVFTEEDATAALGKPAKKKADSDSAASCDYETGDIAQPETYATIAVAIHPDAVRSFTATAQALGAKTAVSGVGDEAFTDGKMSFLARKGDVFIQVVYVDLGGSADATAIMTRAAKAAIAHL